MKKIGFLLVSLVLSVCAAGDLESRAAEVLQVNDGQDGKTVNLTIGQTMTVTLNGNATTGYSWTVLSVSGKVVKQMGAVEYVAPQNLQNKVGAPGTFRARFSALSEGQSKISMGYLRVWEKKAPVKTFNLVVKVSR